VDFLSIHKTSALETSFTQSRHNLRPRTSNYGIPWCPASCARLPRRAAGAVTPAVPRPRRARRPRLKHCARSSWRTTPSSGTSPARSTAIRRSSTAASSRCRAAKGAGREAAWHYRADGEAGLQAGRCSEICTLEWDWVDLENRSAVWPDSKTGDLSKPMSAEA